MKKILKENLHVNDITKVLSSEEGKRKMIKENLTGNEEHDLNSATLILALESGDEKAKEVIRLNKVIETLFSELKENYGNEAERLLKLL